ncbi:MAG: 30S ribosome-binding factor RbfA [Defluviitaleaceae bacterium]|nr:30S ribosome-binding factor RbfA [Defluviitaleaceae bacterium]
MPKNARMIRINDEIARVAADIIRFEMSDPRIGTVVSVTGVTATADLKFCKISVSMLDESGSEETMAALQNAAGFVRKRIAEKVNLRNTPEITFVLDDSIAHAMRMHKLIDEVNRQ